MIPDVNWSLERRGNKGRREEAGASHTKFHNFYFPFCAAQLNSIWILSLNLSI